MCVWCVCTREREGDRQTDRQRLSETERDRDRQTGRQAGRHRTHTEKKRQRMEIKGPGREGE